MPAASDTKWYRNQARGAAVNKAQERSRPPASNAMSMKYGNELLPLIRVPSRSATTVSFSLKLEPHFSMVGNAMGLSAIDLSHSVHERQFGQFLVTRFSPCHAAIQLKSSEVFDTLPNSDNVCVRSIELCQATQVQRGLNGGDWEQQHSKRCA